MVARIHLIIAISRPKSACNQIMTVRYSSSTTEITSKVWLRILNSIRTWVLKGTTNRTSITLKLWTCRIWTILLDSRPPTKWALQLRSPRADKRPRESWFLRSHRTTKLVSSTLIDFFILILFELIRKTIKDACPKPIATLAFKRSKLC